MTKVEEEWETTDMDERGQRGHGRCRAKANSPGKERKL